jgi:hypothetical protein
VAVISARENDRARETIPTIVHNVNAAWGPPVIIIRPKRTGIPETKFLHCI